MALFAWTAAIQGSTDMVLGVFNTTSASAAVPVPSRQWDFPAHAPLLRLEQASLGMVSGTFSPTLATHASGLYRVSGASVPLPWITSIVSGSNRVAWPGKTSMPPAPIPSCASTSETGTYTAIASGLTGNSYTDLTAQNGVNYYYAVSATVNGQQTPNSAAFSVLPSPAQGTVSWNFDYDGTVSGADVAGVAPEDNWNDDTPRESMTISWINRGGTTELD